MLGAVIRSGVALNYVVEGRFDPDLYGFANVILGMFLTSEHTHHIARDLLNITLWSYAIFGNATVISGIVRSSGTVLVPMLITIFSIWGVEVPVAWYLSNHIGLSGVWYGYPAAFIVNLSLQLHITSWSGGASRCVRLPFRRALKDGAQRLVVEFEQRLRRGGVDAEPFHHNGALHASTRTLEQLAAACRVDLHSSHTSAARGREVFHSWRQRRP